jgi:hypothetical protein
LCTGLHFSPLPYGLHVPPIYPSFVQPNNMWWREYFVELFIMHFSVLFLSPAFTLVSCSA